MTDRAIMEAARAWERLEGVIAVVKDLPGKDPKLAAALDVLKVLSQKEDVPLAIVGGLAAIYYGYERYTKDVDVVVGKGLLDTIARVAPRYGIKLIWRDPAGWHKFQYQGVGIDVIPEGGKPRTGAPTTIPSPKHLGVSEGSEYATLAGWIETKLASNRIQDQADIVEVMKKTSAAALTRARKHLEKVHRLYLARFDELHAAAKEERLQERERGGER